MLLAAGADYGDAFHYSDGHPKPLPELGSSGLVSSCNKWETPSLVLLDSDNTRKRMRRMTRGVTSTARLMQEELTDGGFRFRSAMITLTYRPGVDWSPRHIAVLLTHYRKWCKRQRTEFRYVWVLELTKAGVPHYHIIAWLPRGVTPPLPDKQGWWPHGMTNAKWATSPVGYIAKYASKGIDSAVTPPKGARLWGAGGLSAVGRVQRAWIMAPKWLRQLVDCTHHVKKLKGGFWADLTNRINYRSPWEVDLTEGVLRWRGWTSWDVECNW